MGKHECNYQTKNHILKFNKVTNNLFTNIKYCHNILSVIILKIITISKIKLLTVCIQYCTFNYYCCNKYSYESIYCFYLKVQKMNKH